MGREPIDRLLRAESRFESRLDESWDRRIVAIWKSRDCDRSFRAADCRRIDRVVGGRWRETASTYLWRSGREFDRGRILLDGRQFHEVRGGRSGFWNEDRR